MSRHVVYIGAFVLALVVSTSCASRAKHVPVRVEPSCGFSTGAVRPLPRVAKAVEDGRRIRIVAIGSSTTQGVGASSSAKTYPSQLRDILDRADFADKVEVVNLGIGGEKADQTLRRIESEIPKLDPDLVVWQVGTNDGLAGVPVTHYEKVVRKGLDFLDDVGADVVLVGMQWTREFEANPGYRAVLDATFRAAGAENVDVVDRFDAMKAATLASGREDQIGPDRLHMNDFGYRCLAEEVAETVSKSVDVAAPSDGT